jgi:hypothetical protein
MCKSDLNHPNDVFFFCGEISHLGKKKILENEKIVIFRDLNQFWKLKKKLPNVYLGTS